MNIFFMDQVRGEVVVFFESEVWYCIQVFCYKVGDCICFIDGQGGLYEGEIVEVGKKICLLKVIFYKENYGKCFYWVYFVVVLIKNISWMEWLLEKVIEIGLDIFMFLLCSYFECWVLKMEWLEKIVFFVVKQFVKVYFF